MMDIQAQRMNGASPYWRVRFEIHFRAVPAAGNVILLADVIPAAPMAEIASIKVTAAHAWYRFFLNQGALYYSDVPDEGVQQTPSGKLVPLDSAGYKIIPSKAVWICSKRCQSKSWAALALQP
jgi:hypothetical protein